MSAAQSGSTDRKKAQAYYEEGRGDYQRWVIDSAVKNFQAAVKLQPDKGLYHMSLAQALARSGDFDHALRSLANYLRLEPNSPVASRIEQLFASGMDAVEEVLTAKTKAAQIPLDMIGAAIQMWMEFRISLGEESLVIPKPEAWAAALDYTVRKVNLRDTTQKEIASYYGVSADTVRKHHELLVEMLDIMPCDYRYFTGVQNPLDKLVEAAELLESLEARFREA